MTALHAHETQDGPRHRGMSQAVNLSQVKHQRSDPSKTDASQWIEE
jgi:hypothetical protein